MSFGPGINAETLRERLKKIFKKGLERGGQFILLLPPFLNDYRRVLDFMRMTEMPPREQFGVCVCVCVCVEEEENRSLKCGSDH